MRERRRLTMHAAPARACGARKQGVPALAGVNKRGSLRASAASQR